MRVTSVFVRNKIIFFECISGTNFVKKNTSMVKDSLRNKTRSRQVEKNRISEIASN